VLWNDLTAIGAFVWFGVLLLPWRPWGTRESMDSGGASPDADLSDVTVVIPARDESEVIGTTLSSLRGQGQGLQVVLVDDRSADGTVTAARTSGVENLQIVSGEPLPAEWSGKLWALEQGFRHVKTPLVLLINADIQLHSGIVQELRRKLKEDHLQFVSLMAPLRMVRFWERVLMPAFVYFFKMLYPFRLSNSDFTGVAAAAGGCILLETRLIEEVGGFKAIRNELIDDCALAKRVKLLGCRTWIGLTHSAYSLRSYEDLAGIWSMVARTAFCQLRYSPWLLAGTTVAMVTVFWLPAQDYLSSHQRKGHVCLCLRGIDFHLPPYSEVLRAVSRVGCDSAVDRDALSGYDLVVGNTVMGWNRVTLERKIVCEAQEALTCVKSVDQHGSSPSCESFNILSQ
jgi:hopene-associated glycosyltransferase HpnB